MVNVVLVVSLVFALVVAIFAVQNNTPVDIAFLGWKHPEISLVLVIIGSAVAGALAVFCLSLVKQFKLNMELRHAKGNNEKLNSQIASLESKLEALISKTQPVDDSGCPDTNNGKGAQDSQMTEKAK